METGRVRKVLLPALVTSQGGLFLWLVNKYKMQPNERATRKQLIDKALEEGRLVIWK